MNSKNIHINSNNYNNNDNVENDRVIVLVVSPYYNYLCKNCYNIIPVKNCYRFIFCFLHNFFVFHIYVFIFYYHFHFLI